MSGQTAYKVKKYISNMLSVLFQIEKTKKSDCTSMAQSPVFLHLQTNWYIAWVQIPTSPVRSCRDRLCLAKGGLRVSCFTT